jgi:hypothetical protein
MAVTRLSPPKAAKAPHFSTKRQIDEGQHRV